MEMFVRAVYLGLLLGSFALASRALLNIIASIRAKFFAKTTCDTIDLKCQIDQGDKTYSGLTVYYSFLANGKTYTSGRICYGIPPLQTLENLRQQEKSRKQPFPVYYSPLNPHRCVLITAVCPSSIAMLLFFGCAFVTLAVILVSGSFAAVGGATGPLGSHRATLRLVGGDEVFD